MLLGMRVIAIACMAAPDAAEVAAPRTEVPATIERSEAAAQHELGQAAFIAADFASCVEHLEAALAAGVREQPTDVRTVDIRLSLGMCRTEQGRVQSDPAELRRAASLFQGIVDDADELAYDAADVMFATTKLAEIERLLASASAPQSCPEPPPPSARTDVAERRVADKRRRIKGGVLVGTGALLVVVGGGLIGYGAAVLPQAREFGVEDQRPWRAYSAISLGFGVAAATVGIGGIVWGALTLADRRSRRVAFGHRGVAVSF